MDLIRVNELLVTVLLHSGSRWPPKGSKPTAQPIHVSLAIPHDISSTAESDDLSKSINYSTLASTLRSSLSPNSNQEPAFESLEQVLLRSFDLLLLHGSNLPRAYLKIVQLKPPLHCKALAIEGEATRGTGLSWNLTTLQHRIEDLECQTIIGVNPAERLERQLIRINVSIAAPNPTLVSTSEDSLNFRALTRRLYQKVEETSYLTLEALTSFIALETLRHLSIDSPPDFDPKVTVRAAKPYALVFANSSEVEISRRSRDYPNQLSSPTKQPVDQPALTGIHSAAIALGSNIGDSFQNIEVALRLLEVPLEVITDRDIIPGDASLSVVDTSFLYESTPMYVTDQPSFINCACMIETNIIPTSLLVLLKKIEEIVGRQPSFRNGPRAIDLDIILYDQLVIDTRPINDRQTLDNLKGHLVVPHPRMAEREFVLRPLFDMIPNYVHPSLHKKIDTLLKELLFISSDPPMDRVIPFPRYPLPPTNPSSPSSPVSPGIDPVPPTLTHWKYPSPASKKATTPSKKLTQSKTRIMATLNATPDSFSDGSVHNTIPTALGYVREAARAMVDVMDVGGYSTRPGAAFVSVEEEIGRVVPVVRAMRSLGEDEDGEVGEGHGASGEEEELRARVRSMPISIDTFRPEVAEKAILAGANCINDVYAFTGPGSFPYPPAPHPPHPLPPGNSGDVDKDGQAPAAEYMREMKRIARKLGVPVVLMHSRGDAGMNKDYSEYDYVNGARNGWGLAGSGSAVLEGVRVELGRKVEEIVKGKGGVRRWYVIVDPGIGFSKTVEDNLTLLRCGGEVTDDVLIGVGTNRKRNPLAGYPQLVGTSRKSFLGAILQKERGKSTEGKDRTWATTAAVACAVQQGTLVVRAHDTDEMKDVVAVADALWR